MFTLKQCKSSANGLVIDAVSGVLKAVKPQRQTPPREQGGQPGLVQDFQIVDPSTNDFLYGSIWDHQPIDALVGSMIILASVKSGNGRFGGVQIKHNTDKTDPSKVYVNLSVSRAGVVHNPDTYAAATNTTPPAAAPAAPAPAPVAAAPVPAPQAPAPVPAPVAQQQAPAPAPVPQPQAPAPVPQAGNVQAPPMPPQNTPPAPLPGSLQEAEQKAVNERYHHATFKDVVACYQESYAAAHRSVNPAGVPDGATLSAIQAGAATIFIACDRKGIIEGFSETPGNPY